MLKDKKDLKYLKTQTGVINILTDTVDTIEKEKIGKLMMN